MNEAAEEIMSALQDMYDSYVAGDRERFDTHLDEQLTAWESHLPELVDRADLDAYRDNRGPHDMPPVAELRVLSRHIEVWGDRALACYELISIPPGEGEGEIERRRVTDLLRLTDSGWRIVHHHAELWEESA